VEEYLKKERQKYHNKEEHKDLRLDLSNSKACEDILLHSGHPNTLLLPFVGVRDMVTQDLARILPNTKSSFRFGSVQRCLVVWRQGSKKCQAVGNLENS
jgi:hypothetical protein